ncbi:MAG: PepSY-associated TM helix domain-containing protein [Marinifilaceae bacterium]
MNKFIAKGIRFLHRELSFFFAGVIVIYAVSGIFLNHKSTFNADYSIKRHIYTVEESVPVAKSTLTKEYVLKMLEEWDEAKNYTQHYFPTEQSMKVFLKGGSSLVMDLSDGKVLYESVRKRPVLSAFNRLHYNPGRGWTIFSDIFAVSLLIITITGIFMVKGRKGLIGRGGIELLAGIGVTVAFILWV